MPPEVPNAGTTRLAEIETRLRAEIEENRLPLTAAILDSETDGPVHSLFSTLETDELTFSAPAVTRDARILTLTGQTSLLGFEQLDATLTVEVVGEELKLDLSARLVDSEVLSLPGSEFGVRNVGLSMSVAGAPPAATGKVHGTLRAGSLDVPISLSRGPNGWAVRGEFEPIALPGPADLLELAGGEDLVAAFPEELFGGEAALALSGFEITSDSDETTLAFLSLSVQVTRDWHIVPDRLALRNVELFGTVMRPMDANLRSVFGRVEGDVDVAGRLLPVAIDLPAGGGPVRLELNTIERTRLPGLADLASLVGIDAAGFLPPGLDASGEVWVSRLQLDLDLARASLPLLSFAFGIERDWEVVPNLLTLAYLSIEMTVEDAPGSTDLAVTGAVRGIAEVAGVGIALDAELEDDLVLTGAISRIDLARVAAELLGGAALPEELPDVELFEVEVQVTPATGAFSLRGSAQVDWDLGGTSVEARIDLELDRDSSHVDCSISVLVEGPVAVHDEVTFEELSLDFDFDQGSSWSIAGGLKAVLLDHELTLEANYEEVDGVRSLCLSTAATESVELVSLEGIGSFDLEALAIVLTRAESEAGQDSSALAWSLSGEGRLRIAELLDFGGRLTIHDDANSAGLVFEPDVATVSVLLPVPQQDVSIGMELGRISILRGADAEAGWQFAASTQLTFQGVPDPLGELMPAELNAELVAGRGEVRLSADRVLAPLELDIPDLEVGAASVALGKALLDASDLSVHLGKNLELTLDLGLGLPEELNNVFGVEDDGQPSMDFFRTYDPARPEETQVKLRFAIGSAGVSVTPLSSPLQAIVLVEEDGRSFFDCDFGELGAVRLQVPVFSLEGAGLVASGGFKVVEPLRLPLTPLKLLLGGAGEALPDSLPLEGVRLFDDAGDFLVEDLAALLEAGTGPLPDGFRGGLDLLGQRLDRLPDGLKQYLEVEIPDSFHFDVSIRSGSVRLDVGVDEGDPPVRLLFPGMVGALPGLNGIELRNLAFGPVLGGALFQLEIDARIDQFDIATLAASLLLPEDGTLPLPDSRTLQRRIVLDKLFLIVVYQTGVPIPVPLFYDELGIEYLGLEGVQLETHASFPMPTFDMGEAAAMLSDFKRFFSDPEYLLDTEDPPENMNLTFSLGANYIQLPAYLGGRLLGSRQDGGSIDAYENLAHLLNGLKRLELNQLIRAIPMERRVGTTDVSLGPLTMSGAWAITTPAEFMDGAFERLDLPAEQAQETLAILPLDRLAAGDDPQGMVIFLRGASELAGIVSVEGLFGLMASSTGFATGVRLSGTLANALELELAGTIYVDPGRTLHDSLFGLDGLGRLSLQGQEILTGEVQFDESSIRIAGKIDLFPGVDALRLSGDVEASLARESFLIAGQLEATILGIHGEADLRLTHEGFSCSVKGSLFELFECSLTVRGGNLGDAGGFAVSAEMRSDLLTYLNREATAAIQAVADAATEEIDEGLELVADARTELGRIDGQIASLRTTIEAERAEASRGLTNARAAVTAAQQSVDGLESSIAHAKNQINALKNAIRSKRRWYDARPWYEKGWAWGVYAAYVAGKNAQIAAQNVAIAALETAKWAALGALEVAKGALGLVQAGIESFPIEADPRMLLLAGAKGGAQLALNAAELFLEGARAAVGAAAEVGTFIVEGLATVLHVSRARFDASLGDAQGGRISLMLDLVFMGGAPRTLAVAFDFNDPIRGAQSLASALLPT